MFPPIPTWDAAHPMIVHLPLGLLMGAPLLIIAGLIFKRISTGLMVAALIVMAIGTLGIYAAVSTGGAAEHAAKNTALAKQVLHEHEELAELSQILFTVLALVFAGIVLIPMIFKKQLSRIITVIVSLIYLVLYTGSLVILANTAHQGGRLVHTYGVHAQLHGDANIRAAARLDPSAAKIDEQAGKKDHD